MRKLYTCCPHDTCGAFQQGLQFLHSHGMEPAICCDDDGDHYFEFELPEAWSLGDRRQFNEAIGQMVSGGKPCFNCLNSMHQEAAERTCKLCGTKVIVCDECFDDDVESCDCSGQLAKGSEWCLQNYNYQTTPMYVCVRHLQEHDWKWLGNCSSITTVLIFDQMMSVSCWNSDRGKKSRHSECLSYARFIHCSNNWMALRARWIIFFGKNRHTLVRPRKSKTAKSMTVTSLTTSTKWNL